jgi:hypothetical protein
MIRKNPATILEFVSIQSRILGRMMLARRDSGFVRYR